MLYILVTIIIVIKERHNHRSHNPACTQTFLVDSTSWTGISEDRQPYRPLIFALWKWRLWLKAGSKFCVVTGKSMLGTNWSMSLSGAGEKTSQLLVPKLGTRHPGKRRRETAVVRRQMPHHVTLRTHQWESKKANVVFLQSYPATTAELLRY